MAIVRTDDQYYHDIADAIREKTGGTEDLLPENMAEELNNATLEELYVTPSSSEQTFTPESPCIGFSVVTVEAAPEPEIPDVPSYPSADGGSFGNVVDSEEVYSNLCSYNGHLLPALPEEYLSIYPYARIIYYTGNSGYSPKYYLTFCDKPAVGTAMNHIYLSTITGYVAASNIGNEDAAWLEFSSRGDLYGERYSIVWANHDILHVSTKEVLFRGTPPVPQFKEGAVLTPSEVEDAYIVSGSDLNALAAVTQRLTGAGTMNMSGIISALESIAP